MSSKYKDSKDVPSEVLVKRLKELSDAATKGREGQSEFNMRIPAQVDRDADIVLLEAALRLERLENEVHLLSKQFFTQELQKLPLYKISLAEISPEVQDEILEKIKSHPVNFEPLTDFNKDQADKLAYEVAKLVIGRHLNSRSGASDALLLYLNVGGINGPSTVPEWIQKYEGGNK